jgi:integrase/recombinase XerC
VKERVEGMKNELLVGNTSFVKASENFISYLDVSEQTLETYRRELKPFFEYLIDNNIQQPTRSDLRMFRDKLKEKMSGNTINGYLTAVRRFFNYLEANGIYENITKDVKNIKTSKVPKRQVLTLEQTKAIYNSLTDLREKCLFGLFVSTGMRAIEVSRALIEDIKVHNGEVVLFFQGKMRDDKNEYVKLSAQTLNDIFNYIGDRKSGNIFISTSNNNKGNGVTTKTLRLEIKKIFKRFNLDYDTFSCHSLRRTFATIAYNGGADIYQIQEVLRHRSLNTTQRYISQTTRDNNKTECNVSNLIFG